jgi:hypothetical protein
LGVQSALVYHRDEHGTTVGINNELSGTGILYEDTNCQFYSEAFILLPESDGYTNTTPTSNQVLPPHLPELISSVEQHQIVQDSQQTHRTLAALETITRRSSPANQQPYVELRDLLENIATDNAEAYETAWLYGLVIFSIFLSLGLLILKYWQRPVAKTSQKTLPCITDQRPNHSHVIAAHFGPGPGPGCEACRNVAAITMRRCRRKGKRNLPAWRWVSPFRTPFYHCTRNQPDRRLLLQPSLIPTPSECSSLSPGKS